MSVSMAQTWLGEQDSDKVATAIAELNASDSKSAQDARRYAGGDDGFALWLWLANRRCQRLVEVSIFDLSDWTWRDAYENGDSPKDAVREALSEDDLYASFFADGGE